MSPLPDPSHKSQKPPVPESAQSNEPTLSASDVDPDISTNRSPEPALEPSGDSASASSSESTPLIAKPPLMRPVSRPQPPAKPANLQKPAAPLSPPPASSKQPPEPSQDQQTIAAISSSEDAALDSQAIVRQQPIPPPSEPKQYRAIGLVRGMYKPSEEQFTRGEMVTEDGAMIEAVLLGRVMSLVKNHLDLEQDHLWVVYPRTRETKPDLHLQIVGVWEPEKLHRESTEETDAAEESADDATEAPAPTPEDPSADSLSPGFEDDYFSIRGEVVFFDPENDNVVVKIQQAPRKDTDKAKAFKLQLKGALPVDKALGYFWDLHVQRQETSLVITTGNSIGLVPPKKKKKRAGGPPRGDRKPFRKGPDARGAVGKPTRPTGVSAPRREPLPKPSKRSGSDQSEG